MSPVSDIISTLYDKAADVFGAWVLFALFPVLVPALLALFAKGQQTGKLKFALSAAARLFGWPTLFIALLGPPWFLFEVYLVPVILDAYPWSRSLLSGPLSMTHWLTWNSYWLVPVLWVGWVLYGSLRFRRAWLQAQMLPSDSRKN